MITETRPQVATIRAAQPSDADDIVRLCRDAVDWSDDMLRADLGADNRLWLVALSGSRPGSLEDRRETPVGCLGAEKTLDAWTILAVAVDPIWRRQGIARQLIDACAAAAAEANVGLQLEVSETNVDARLLYSSRGFIEVGRRPRYYADGADALLLDLLPEHFERGDDR